MAAEISVPHKVDNPMVMAQQLLKQGCEALDLDPGVYEILKEPARVYTVSIPVKMDSGELRTFIGYRSQHTNVTGPVKGGIRFYPTVTLDEIKAHSILMTLKCNLIGLPYGGAKGAVVCNPKELSRKELERLSRGYVRAIAPNIGPEKDIPAPDVYTNPQIMAWMMDEFSRIQGHYTPAVITGKPLALGGSAGRNEATARGCVYTIIEAANHLGLKLDGAAAVIQGYGNAGSISATLLAELGVRIVGVSDSQGAVVNPDGMDPHALIEHKEKTGSVRNFPGATEIPRDEILEYPCDILVPAALESVITSRNAPRIKARIVAEAANAPTTPRATEILFERGIMVIPDILANAGGVTVSYFEWVQNLQHFYWTEEEVNTRLKAKMVSAFERTCAMSINKKVNMRLAAYMVALERIAKAMALRSWLTADTNHWQ